MPIAINQGTATLSYTYDPERNRSTQTTSGSGEVRSFFPAFGVRAEKVDGSWENFIYAGDRLIARVDGSGGSERYFHLDHVGSVHAITNQSGTVLDRLSYNAWGQRRLPSGDDGLVVPLVTDRGYTGHQHLDTVGLIHMNGRVYDPILARFLSADPFVSDAFNSQALNPYSYVENNPLSATDPSGFFIKRLLGKVTGALRGALRDPRQLLAIIALVVLQQHWALPTMLANMGLAAGTAANAIGSAAIAGGISGAIASGGDLKSIALSAATAVAFYGVGQAAEAAGLTGKTHLAGIGDDVIVSPTAGQRLAHAAMHGTVGGLREVALGGKFQQGFLSAGVAKFAGSPLGTRQFGGVGGTAAQAVIGGTVSVLAGGKFANGATTAAFGYLFNEVWALSGRLEIPTPLAEDWARVRRWLGQEGAAPGEAASIGIALQFPAISEMLRGDFSTPLDIGGFVQVEASANGVPNPSLNVAGEFARVGGRIHGDFDAPSYNINIFTGGGGASLILSEGLKPIGNSFSIGGGYGLSGTKSFTGAYTLRDLLGSGQ